MTISEYNKAVSKFKANFRLGLTVLAIGLIDCGLAASPNDFGTSLSARSRWGIALLGFIFFLPAYFWLKKALGQRRNLLCPSCKDWLCGAGPDKPTSSGKCPACSTKIISDIEERIT